MSNIIKDKDTLLILNDIIKYVQNNEITESYLEEILKLLLPSKDGELLVRCNIREKGFDTAEFIPQYNKIKISINKLNEWLDINTNSFSEDFNSSDLNILRSYLFLFVITHEIEHSYQYLMGQNLVDAPNEVLKDAYKELFNFLIPKAYIIPRPIKQIRRIISLNLYKLNQNLYFLERNANIESMDLVSICALYNDRDDIYELFGDMKNAFMKCGYLDSNIGSIEETYRKILMYDKFIKFYRELNISEDEKVRYGFSINEDTRYKVLNKVK